MIRRLGWWRGPLSGFRVTTLWAFVPQWSADVTKVENPGRPIQPGSVVRLSRVPPAARSNEILRELGASESDILVLRAEGLVA